MTTQQPDALRLADFLDDLDFRTPYRIMNCISAAAELRRLEHNTTILMNALMKACFTT